MNADGRPGSEFRARLQESGRIESSAIVLLHPLTATAGRVVERLGVVRGALGAGLQQQIEIYRQAIGSVS